MVLRIHKISAEDWKPMSEHAHIACFSEKRTPETERIDYTLLAVDAETEKPQAYVTIKEYDSGTIYWQYGGGFPGSIGIPAFRAYEAFVNWASERYERVYTLIENKNTRMLKMAMKVGFKIIGVKCVQGSIMLEHLIEFGG